MKLIAIITLCALPCAGQLPAIWATLRAEVQDHRGLAIRLGDIAEVRGTDPELVRSLERLFISEQRTAGGTRVLDRETIAGLLEKEGKGRFASAVVGASRVTVRAAELGLQNKDIEALAESFLLHELRGFRGNPRIKSVKAEGPLPTMAGTYSCRYEVRYAEGSSRDRGIVRLEVLAIVDGKETAKVPVQIQVQRDGEVYVTTRAIQAGREITAADIERVSMVLDYTNEEAITEIHQVVGKIAKGRMNRGHILTAVMLKDPPVVFRRDEVTVEAQVGALLIEGRGTILEDGSIGETVRVRMEPSNKQILAQVIDSRRVRLNTP